MQGLVAITAPLNIIIIGNDCPAVLFAIRSSAVRFVSFDEYFFTGAGFYFLSHVLLSYDLQQSPAFGKLVDQVLKPDCN